MLQLSNIAPDFDSLVNQLMTAADSFPDTWKDRITSSTGQTLVEMLAAIGAYSQYSIESSYQEAFPSSAKNAEAIYAASNFAGVRTNRKSPASITFNMTAPAPVTIPPLTKFVGGGTNWFNRAALNLSPTPTQVTLYQGDIVERQIFGLGTPFQAYVTQETGFRVSDTDVFVTINDVSVPVIQEGLWTLPLLPGLQQFTLPNGAAIMLFGNQNYGSMPGTNDLCKITYVVTNGEASNNIVTVNRAIAKDGDPTITGTPVGNPSGGAKETDYVVYKNVTPALFGSFDAAVTAQQYKRLPLQYPGVIDALVLSQREINPNALNWMNVMKVSLLTSTVWDNTAWSTFRTWFLKHSMYAVRIFREDPVPLNVTPSVRVHCKNFSNLDTIKVKVEEALDNLFAKRQGSIGLDVYLSDIDAAVRKADSNIEYVEILNPTANILIASLNVKAPTLTAVPGGTLPAGTYDYAISMVSSLGGETAPAEWASITVPAGGYSIQLDWIATQNAANYKVWGRVTGGAVGLLATVSSGVLTFTDTGSIVPTGTVPVQSTVASRYPNLTSKTVEMVYSVRNIR